ncbi:hypothetical protein [Luteibacter jiangsuensis]
MERKTSIVLGDDRVASWESIGTNAVATAAGTYIGNTLSPGPSAQANLAAWNRQGGGLSAYGALDAGGNGYSLVEGTASSAGGYAYLDNGNALRSYGLNYYAGTRAIDAAIGSDALTTTPQGNVRVEDVQWSGSDGSLGYGGIGFPMRPVAIPYTAEPIPTLSSANVTANPAGVIDEHYDPVWARQQAALAAQASEMDAANQQRLSDFFNDQALHIVGAPIYALSGAAKEAVNGAKSLGHTLWAGGEFQAAKYAAFGAAARGDLRGIDAADRLGAQALADASTPVAPVFQVSAFEHAAAFGVPPFNPEEAAVAGMSFVERMASGLSGVARAGASVDSIVAARGGFEAAEGAMAPTMASDLEGFGIAARYEPGEMIADEQRLVSNGMPLEVVRPMLDRRVVPQISMPASDLNLVDGSRVAAEDASGFHYVSSNGLRGEVPLSATQRAEVDTYLDMFDLDGVAVRHVDDTNLNTGYLHGEMFSILNVGSDVVPGNVGLGTLAANSRISIRGTIAHEIVGHREAALAGKTQPINALEEAQASIRAARFAPGLTSTERFTLLRDGVTRLYNAGLRIRDYRDMLYIEQR